MIPAKIPSDEKERLEELYSLDLLDTAEEKDFDDLTKIASQILGTPISLVSLVDKDRQWFKSKLGIDEKETPRDVAFCAHAILEPNRVFVVEDALEDERFQDNPLVTISPNIRFYVGAPLVTSKGYPIGTLCAMDNVPREIEPEKMEALEVLAKQTIAQIELRTINKKLNQRNVELNQLKEELTEYHNRVSKDLSMAQEIQNSLIPSKYPDSKLFQISSRYYPIDEVGGDAIGFFASESLDHLDIFFADVSGHGIASALISAMSLLAFDFTSQLKLSPSDSLQNIHENLTMVHNGDHFISCCYLRFYPKTKSLEYAYGGHHPILLFREGKLEELPGRGSLLLTVLPPNRDIFDIELLPGDRIILISDGYFDVFNPEMQQLGWDRIKTWIEEIGSIDPESFLEQLTKKVKIFSDLKRQDDMTILVLDIK